MSTILYVSKIPKMINFDEVDFSECRSKEW